VGPRLATSAAMSLLLRAFPRGLLASHALGVGLRSEVAAACRLLTGVSGCVVAFQASPPSPASPAAVAGSISFSPFRSFAASADQTSPTAPAGPSDPATLIPRLYVANL
jgi:hypothetical protein